MLITLDDVAITDPLHMDDCYLAQGSGFCAMPQMINFQFLLPFTNLTPYA